MGNEYQHKFCTSSYKIPVCNYYIYIRQLRTLNL